MFITKLDSGNIGITGTRKEIIDFCLKLQKAINEDEYTVTIQDELGETDVHIQITEN